MPKRTRIKGRNKECEQERQRDRGGEREAQKNQLGKKN